jgi:hypothetical protein
MSMAEVMSLDEFLDALRHAARFDSVTPPDKPLSAAVARIRDNPALSQSRLLGRILRGLTHKVGEFRRAEASAFDAATLRLIVALIESARSGINTRAEWLDAVAAADLANS